MKMWTWVKTWSFSREWATASSSVSSFKPTSQTGPEFSNRWQTPPSLASLQPYLKPLEKRIFCLCSTSLLAAWVYSSMLLSMFLILVSTSYILTTDSTVKLKQLDAIQPRRFAVLPPICGGRGLHSQLVLLSRLSLSLLKYYQWVSIAFNWFCYWIGLAFYSPSAAILTYMPWEATTLLVSKIDHLKLLLSDVLRVEDCQVQRARLHYCIRYHQEILRQVFFFQKCTAFFK